MAIRPVLIDKQSPFLGESCALCKEPFSPGQEILICPEDATRHHLPCWRANGDRCSAYGCEGRGRPIVRRPPVEEDDVVEGTVITADGFVRTADGRSKVQALPTTSLSCAQSCLVIAIALSILIVAVSCFGLWAMLDYLMMEVFDMPYREPLSSALPLLVVLA